MKNVPQFLGQAGQEDPRAKMERSLGLPRHNYARQWDFHTQQGFVPPPEPTDWLRCFPPPVQASQLSAGEPQGNWIWQGYIARHTTTLFSSLWKAGKTTLFAHLLKIFEAGGEFCGRAVKPTKVFYLSEESQSMWAARREQLGIGDHVFFQCRPFRMRPSATDWLDLMNHIRRFIDKKGIELVFIDPLTTLWPVGKENDAAAVADGILPLNILTDKAAVVLSHHLRKCDGGEATGSRGSGALTGFVDTIVELRRYMPSEGKDTRRVLTGCGRFEETPPEVVVQLTAKGFVAQGDRSELKREALLRAIRAVLTPEKPGWDYDTLKTHLTEEMDGESPHKSRILEALESGITAGWIFQSGEGKKGDPKRYRVEEKCCSCSPP